MIEIQNAANLVNYFVLFPPQSVLIIGQKGFLGIFCANFSEAKSTFALNHTFLAGLHACMVMIIAISVNPCSAHIDGSHCTILQRFPKDWYQVTPDSKALEKALQCTFAIFWFSAFLSAVTSVTRKRKFIVFLLTGTQGTIEILLFCSLTMTMLTQLYFLRQA